MSALSVGRPSWNRKAELIRGALCALSIFVVSAAPAHADAGIPMLAVVWPCSWILLLPVIAIESWVAVRFLNVSWKEAIRLAGLSNLVSTVLGIPVTWGLCVLLEMMVGIPGATALARYHVGDGSALYGLMITAPWLYPESPYWMVLTAALILCVPFYFMSVWTEGLLVRRIAKAEQKPEAMRWAWRSNGASYALIVVMLVVLISTAARK